MYKIRQISYSKGSTSVQVYKIENRKRVIIRHIGTAHNEEELNNLMILAKDFIETLSKQLSFFDEKESDKTLYIDQVELIGVHYGFFYELISKLILTLGLDKIKNNYLLDLVIMRLKEPASKLRSIELLDEYFGIKLRRQDYYKFASEWLNLKSKVESIILAFTKEHYDFNFDLLLYDVTTLYFETFEGDELRKNGFSKDNKSQQPQILIALMVTKEGFPIAYEIFSGDTFEGHTILPVVSKFIQKNNVKTFTIVADAAMISEENIKILREHNINYIVGARIKNLSNQLTEEIDKNLKRNNGEIIRVKTKKGYLICSYSSSRYHKDKYEMEKQIEKAKLAIKNPSKRKQLKFTRANNTGIELNEELILKTQKLLGIKGYYTDLEENIMNNQSIISHYHQLYRIEQNFRIAKSDLQARPIFHFKEDPIKLHILICFIALSLAKHIELQAGISFKKFVQESNKITDARLKNLITKKEIKIRTKLNPKIKEIIEKLNLLT